jgi:class 3 adenylate cyclase
MAEAPKHSALEVFLDKVGIKKIEKKEHVDTQEDKIMRKQKRHAWDHVKLAKYYATLRAEVVNGANSFLPVVIQDLLDGPGLKEDQVFLRRVKGAVVFSNASGFTQLTSSLAKKENGAEVLAFVFRSFFTPLIDLLLDYRGDIIKFNGEGLSVFFEERDDKRIIDDPAGTPGLPIMAFQLALLRAACCCIEIHKRMNNFDTKEFGENGESLVLCLHIGLGAGELTFFQAGGIQDRYEYVCAGNPINQATIAEPMAQNGETVVSPEAWEEIKQLAYGTEVDPAYYPGFMKLLR